MKKKYYLIFGALLIVAAAVFFLFIIFHTNAHKEKSVVLPTSLAERLGQSFIVGFDGTELDENTKNILTEIKPAGIILYYRNYKNPKQLKDLISQLQDIAKKTTKHPYFIMIDEEPGGATRLDVFDNVFAFGTPDWKQIEQGVKDLQGVGINVDLAPIADFPFDNNSFIKDRVPARDPQHLMEFNKQFIATLQKYNVLATLKHFPGMGVFVDDPHEKLPYADPTETVIDQSLQIFKSGIDAGADFVMTAHGVYDDIDPKNSATTSKKIVTDILKKQLGFSGLTITDDLSDMPFIINKQISLTDATAQSLLAGQNLVIFSHRLESTKIIFDQLLKKAEDDNELQSIIDSNYIKIVSLKNKKL